jgi:hypothetical protein
MGRGCRTLDEDDYEHAEVGAEDAEHSRPEGIPRLIDDNAATDSSGHFGERSFCCAEETAFALRPGRNYEG